MDSTQSLPITGYRSAPVPHTLFQQDEETGHAAIILPGWRYTVQRPLLFYVAALMRSLKADVLTVEYAYNRRRDFQACDEDQRLRWFLTDVRSACQTLLKHRVYQRLTLIGKSFGTRAMGYLLTEDDLPEKVSSIWLTPLLKNHTLREQLGRSRGRALFISGTADPHYDAAHMADVQAATGGRVVLVDGADHSLNIAHDVPGSVRHLATVIEGINDFVMER